MATSSNNLDNYFTALSGGADATPATGTHKRIIISGSWAAGDKIFLSVLYNEVQFDLGHKDITQADVTYVMTFRNQIMLCAGDRLYFSGIDEPTGFENRYAGYGYIVMSGERGEAVEALAVVPYAGKLALFARNNVQLWLPNPDPDEWQLVQSLENIGTCSPKSVVSYGELDVFFLAETGLRSLRVRESTDLVNVQDVGSALDPRLQSILANLSEDDKRYSVFGYYSIRDGRYWLFVGPVIYVFSYFPSTRVAAWSTYQPAYWNYVTSAQSYFAPLWTAAWNGKLFLVSLGTGGEMDARTLAVYPAGSELDDDKATELATALTQFQAGTITFAEYEAQVDAINTQYEVGHHTTAILVVPFYDQKQPATTKQYKAVDLLGEGTWKVEVATSVNSPDEWTTVVEAITLNTVEYGRLPLGFYGTHIRFRLKNTTNEQGVLASLIVHWEPANAD